MVGTLVLAMWVCGCVDQSSMTVDALCEPSATLMLT